MSRRGLVLSPRAASFSQGPRRRQQRWQWAGCPAPRWLQTLQT